jgi:integrase/recombinase XerC
VELGVVRDGPAHRLGGSGRFVEFANRFLEHLEVRGYASATVRGYAYDLLNFGRFLAESGLDLDVVVPTDIFDWIGWQQRSRKTDGKVVRLDRARAVAPSTINRRVAAVRGLFEFAVQAGEVVSSPVPSGRRAGGVRARRGGLLAHVKRRRAVSGDGRLVRQGHPLPESLGGDEVAAFLMDLNSHRDRAIVLGMLLGGLRAGEIRGLLLADVDFGLRRVRVVGKGGRVRVVPVDGMFFTELSNYLRLERPSGLTTAECFVVLRGLTTGAPMSEDGLRKIFRTHRLSSGAKRVRPHRLRHTYGTELATAGIDLLVLQQLMGHANPETTSMYVHLSAEQLAAEYARARQVRP